MTFADALLALDKEVNETVSSIRDPGDKQGLEEQLIENEAGTVIPWGFKICSSKVCSTFATLNGATDASGLVA